MVLTFCLRVIEIIDADNYSVFSHFCGDGTSGGACTGCTLLDVHYELSTTKAIVGEDRRRAR